MAENTVGLEEGKSWRMPTEGGEKSKFDISKMFYLGDCTQQWKGGPCIQMGGSVLRGLPILPLFTGLSGRAEGERSSPQLMVETGSI